MELFQILSFFLQHAGNSYISGYFIVIVWKLFYHSTVENIVLHLWRFLLVHHVHELCAFYVLCLFESTADRKLLFTVGYTMCKYSTCSRHSLPYDITRC